MGAGRKGRLRDWHAETVVCAFEGHLMPATSVTRLRPEDAGLGVQRPDGSRLVRCIRCDGWFVVPADDEPTAETLPPLEELSIPKRGRPLRDSLVLKLIAIDRALHALIFALLAVGLYYLDRHLGGLQTGASNLVDAVRNALSDTGQAASRDFLIDWLTKVLNLRRQTLLILSGTAVVYMVVEGVEAVGLWMDKRWAEYLTAVATAGFLPFEINALVDRVTVLRVATLVINVAILAWLLWRKHLFGVGGRYQPHDADIDREAMFGPAAAIVTPDGSRIAARG